MVRGMRCYVDYTCGHSYRAWSWLRGVDAEIEWRTFSLKEVNRDPGSPRAFELRESVSVLALALAHAAREHDFRRYHTAAFEAFHASRVSREDLLAAAAGAGVDTAAIDEADLFAGVAREHDEARERWGIFGTPTVISDDSVAFLRFEEIPTDSSLLDRIRRLARPEGVTIRITAEGAESTG